MTAEPDHPPGPTDWPRQLRLPGQAAAPEGPVDMYMMYLMHHAFRRDLAAFAAAVPRTPVERHRHLAGPGRPLGRSSPRRCTTTTPARTPGSGRRCSSGPTTTERATLLAMEAEHEEIDPLLEASASGFARLAAGADEDARAALAVRLVAARE